MGDLKLDPVWGPGPLAQAMAAADEAIERVEEHANPDWLDAATRLIIGFTPEAEFTTDDVWDHLGDVDTETHEPRALGAVIRRLATRGVIRKTGAYQPSKRRECHARPIPVWRRNRGR